MRLHACQGGVLWCSLARRSGSSTRASRPRLLGGGVLMASTTDIIRVENLRKYYGKTKAVDDISFAVYSGEIFGMLGPNGAGKSTTIEMIEGLREPDAGSVSVLGL